MNAKKNLTQISQIFIDYKVSGLTGKCSRGALICLSRGPHTVPVAHTFGIHAVILCKFLQLVDIESVQSVKSV